MRVAGLRGIQPIAVVTRQAENYLKPAMSALAMRTNANTNKCKLGVAKHRPLLRMREDRNGSIVLKNSLAVLHGLSYRKVDASEWPRIDDRHLVDG